MEKLQREHLQEIERKTETNAIVLSNLRASTNGTRSQSLRCWAPWEGQKIKAFLPARAEHTAATDQTAKQHLSSFKNIFFNTPYAL